MAQLMQGVTPHKIALSIALGLSLGIFPVLGITTTLCVIAALRLRLNQPIIQLVNWLVYPLQLALLLVFIRIGEWLLRAPPAGLSLMEFLQKLHDSPAKFFQEFVILGLQGTVAWMLIAPFLSAITYLVLLPPLKKLAGLKTLFAAPSDLE
jgi:uncharacterized protein (DUF2062 family)